MMCWQMGKFSSDRAIMVYAEVSDSLHFNLTSSLSGHITKEYWNIEPVKV